MATNKLDKYDVREMLQNLKMADWALAQIIAADLPQSVYAKYGAEHVARVRDALLRASVTDVEVETVKEAA